MDVANSSTYDWATSVGEAALMSSRITRATKVLVPDLMSPYRFSVLKTYTEPAGVKVEKIDHDPITGQLDLEDLKDKNDDQTAMVYIENPSYMGFAEEKADAIGEITHETKALYVVGVDPTSLGLTQSPRRLWRRYSSGRRTTSGEPYELRRTTIRNIRLQTR
jgi:glycine dehydrogenase subunit 1